MTFNRRRSFFVLVLVCIGFPANVARGQDGDGTLPEYLAQLRLLQDEEREHRGRWVGEFAGPTGQVVTFSGDGSKLLTAGGTEVRIWDTHDTRKPAVVLRHGSDVKRATLGHGGRVLTAAGDEVKVWNADRGELRQVLRHPEEVLDARFSPDGARIVTACHDGLARVWDAASGRELLGARHGGAVEYACFSPDGARILTLAAEKDRPRDPQLRYAWCDGWASVLDAATGREISARPVDVTNVWMNLPDLFSRDGKRVVTIGAWGAVIWEPGEKEDVIELVIGKIRGPDGKGPPF